MINSIYYKIIFALKQAESHNSNTMVKPEVILWPDLENQWESIIPILQENLPQLLILGNYNVGKRQGSAIWLKCMISKMLPEADWDENTTPIIYLPGISKNELRNVECADIKLQPLIEYQYTGTLFIQDNGIEWNICDFLENPFVGFGLRVSQDNNIREDLKKALPKIFQESDVFKDKKFIDSEYLKIILLPDIIPSILKWMCKGDSFMNTLESDKNETFINLCKLQYGFEPDFKNIKSIAEKLGSQKNAWKYVWQFYSAAPNKFPEIEELLRLAKPDDLGSGIFALPEESWPQVNEEKEVYLSDSLSGIEQLDKDEAIKLLINLEDVHSERRNWVWSELGKSPLANSLHFLTKMASLIKDSIPSSSIEELKSYYLSKGCLIDQYMRKSLSTVNSGKDKKLITSIIKHLYQPWLESITDKFQNLVKTDDSIFTSQKANEVTESFILFFDAFRYELAEDFTQLLIKNKYKVILDSEWSAIPSLTPTSKPNVSPITDSVSMQSKCNEFRPQLKNGNDLQPASFRNILNDIGYNYISKLSEIQDEEKYWFEVGDFDTKGHNEQSDIVRRIDELFEHLLEIINEIFSKGIKKIKIVTDHGWLLLPGGLPKEQLHAGLTETRWGRCALIKEGVKSDLLHLPWRWNLSIFIAYAPGISFFRINEEYAHGGISLHECLIPALIIENSDLRTYKTEITSVKWVNLICTIETSDLPDGFSIDIRTKYSDSNTSIVLSKDKIIKNNTVTLMVDDSFESQAATIVLLDENEIILNKKPTTVGG